MNAKLTEQEYQWMLIELIAQSMEHLEKTRSTTKNKHVDWLYLIERMRVKGILADLKPARENTNAKSRYVAKLIRYQFMSEHDKDVTVRI